MPTPSRILTLSDLVVAELNDANNSALFQTVFTAIRRPMIFLKADQLATLRVSVVPADLDDELLTRGNDTEEILTLAVGVQIAADPDDLSTTDPYLTLAEAIADYFRGKQLGDYLCTESRLRPVVNVEHLKIGVFTSVPLLTFSTTF